MRISSWAQTRRGPPPKSALTSLFAVDVGMESVKLGLRMVYEDTLLDIVVDHMQVESSLHPSSFSRAS